MKLAAGLIAIVIAGSIVQCSAAALAGDGSLGTAPIDSVYRVEGRKDIFRSTNFYFGGQPALETLRWLKSEGVTLVVNLRAEKENKDFAEAAFNEENVVRELGMAYVSIPLGEKASYRPHAVDTFAMELAAHTGKAFIHCLSAGRVSTMWVAYLVRHRGYSLDDAVTIGKRIKYPTTLEDLLGAKISLTYHP
ncbi:MAG: sulfur transferase domain-containing protein [Candidatus Krumholzibacteria bacterium]|nr:sulfur transferase domain-containing protein [Candidatus Krumholzibacteria bacterium]